jgi:NAD(P)-dependent dehydrogenase (short-subunit alcohol dehydrogenase family)
MTQLSFDGKVAIVTGAGGERNLGRAYATCLASRGARVVVNDVHDGAERVAKEIAGEGGEAVAAVHSISEEAGANAIVQTALDSWGRVDVLVNNGGAMLFAGFDEMTSDDTKLMVDTHVMGAVWMSRAVWPHFRAQGQGRIVNALSTATGAPRVMYTTAKYALFGLTYGLAVAGHRVGIACNGIVPLAGTDATQRTVPEGDMKQMMMTMMLPEQVAAAVCFLAHDDCPVNGEAIFAAAGRVKLFDDVRAREGDADGGLGSLMTGGYFNPDLTAEDVRDHWGEIVGPEYRPVAFPDAAQDEVVPYQPSA